MNHVLYYLSQPYTFFTVSVPWAYVIYWYISEGRKNPPNTTLLWHWMPLAICTYFMTVWVITPDRISLHMIDAFFIYLAFYLWLGFKITPGAAYVLSYTSMWAVDMVKAYELIAMDLAVPSTYYFGVGGAGFADGLCIFPIVSAGLVHYVTWRRAAAELRSAFVL